MGDARGFATTGRRAAVVAVSGRRAGLLALAALLLLAGAVNARAGSVALTWNPNAEGDLKGYRLHYGLRSRDYTWHLDVGPTTTWPVEGLDETKTYYFAVTAYDATGNESGPSGELSAQPAAQAPEAVSTPPTPGGPVVVPAGVPYSYTAGAAISSRGHPVQYRFAWADGTVSAWLPVGTGTAQKSWATPGVYSGVRVQARCATHPSVLSAESPPLDVTVIADGLEEVSAPFAPRGPAIGAAGVVYTYEGGGALSSSGDPVQYRFSWSDGTDSGWLPVGTTAAAKSWAVAGTYAAVRLEARCARHPTVTSPPSSPLTVIIEGDAGETVTPPTAPAGAGGGTTWTAYVYSAGGASSDHGHPLLYRYHWGDGETSSWTDADPADAWHSWRYPGTYEVRVEAACALHPGSHAISPALEVSISEHDPLLYSEDFSSTGDWTSRWHIVSGKWGIRGRRMSLTSSSAAKAGLILARPVEGFFAGRFEGRFRLTNDGAGAPNAGLVFAYRDPKRYRYVQIRDRRVTLGEAGATKADSWNVSQDIPKRLAVGKWHRVRLDLHPDGTAAVYLDRREKPVIVHGFGNVVPGGAGFLATKARSYYDDVSVWDGTVLPPEPPPATVRASGEGTADPDADPDPAEAR